MVWWSAQALSRRWARSSTGRVRREFQTTKPSAAAQNPQTIQTTFFMVVLLFSRQEWPCGSMLPAGLDAASFSGVCQFCRRFSWVRLERYTLPMDSVRFGRALGIGTRLAAKTAKAAMDAATAPNPSSKAGAGSRPSVANEAGPVAGLGDRVTRSVAQVQQTGQGLKEGSRRFGTAVGKPLVKLSTVLWLEVTGVFFGLFAMAAGGAAWRLRAAIHATATNHEDHVRFLAGACMAAVFGYFCLTSFVKAN